MARADRIPLRPGRAFAVVHVTLSTDVGANFLVDTGAIRSAISSAVATRLQFDLLHPLRFEPLVGVGQTRPLPVVTLDRMQIGASAVERLTVSVFDLPPQFGVDGIVGLDFLRRFRMTVEFDTRTLILRTPPAPRLRQSRSV